MLDSNLPGAGAIAATLARILASPLFAQAQRQSRLLRYIVERSQAGTAGRLGQFTIGIDVFERDAGFDPVTDSVVRVEVARLRARLREYYEATPDEVVVIRIPKGRYIAVFEHNPAALPVAPRGDRAGQRSARPVLAVLPFVSHTSEGDDDYFATGITEDLITDLSKVSGLTVIARNSSFAYRDTATALETIGRELGASHVLEGSVRRAGARLRINAQLSHCASGEQVWAERFDRDLADIFEVQDEVGQRIIAALATALTALDRYRRDGVGTVNLDAYDLYLRATTLGWSRAEIEEAARLLGAACVLDPEFALAHARRANLLWYQWQVGWYGDERLGDALEAALRSIDIDPDLAEGHAMLAFIRFWLHEHEASEAAFRRVEVLDPNNIRNIERRAICLALQGRAEEAEACVATVQRVNPHEPYYFPRAVIAFVRGHLDAAIDLLEASAARFPAFVPTRIYLAAALALAGRAPAAAAHIAYLQREAPGITPQRLLDKFSSERSTAGEMRSGFREAWLAADGVASS